MGKIEQLQFFSQPIPQCKTEVLAWWSGGIASAVACYWALQTFKNVRVIFIDPAGNEHPDTYRFLKDCEKVYGQYIEVARNEKYDNIEEVWFKFLSLNTANGAICSSELKREVRNKTQNLELEYSQVFGFDKSEAKRILNMQRNYPEINAIAPLVTLGYSKEMCAQIVQGWGIEVPIPYKLGYRNNNCFKTGCVQGGIGYWQKIRDDDYEKFYAMAMREHRLTDLKGKPVTICKDQGKDGGLVFLLPHPNYPDIKHIGQMKGRPVEPLVECIGFCQTIEKHGKD